MTLIACVRDCFTFLEFYRYQNDRRLCLYRHRTQRSLFFLLGLLLWLRTVGRLVFFTIWPAARQIVTDIYFACALDNVFQIRNNTLQCIVIDWKTLKQRSKRTKTVIQTVTETVGNGDKRKGCIHTNEAYRYLFCLCVWYALWF